MILHIVSKHTWAEGSSRETYEDPSLAAEGFIHCSTADQVLIPANERFSGQTDLLLLVLDPALLSSPVIYEDCYESGLEFPHIYGPINRSAVVRTLDFPWNEATGFVLPAL